MKLIDDPRDDAEALAAYFLDMDVQDFRARRKLLREQVDEMKQLLGGLYVNSVTAAEVAVATSV